MNQQHNADGIFLAGETTRRGVVKTALGGGLLAFGFAAQTAAAQSTPTAACPASTPDENTALVQRFWTEVWTTGAHLFMKWLTPAGRIGGRSTS